MKSIKIIYMVIVGLSFVISNLAFAQADAEKGKKIAKKCTTCHTLTEGGKNRLGPNLFGILNQEAGKVEGYRYSKGLLNSGVTWDDISFLDFIEKPKKVIKGTKMSFGGVKKAGQREDLLAYFRTLGGGSDNKFYVGNIAEGKIVAANHCVVCHSFEKGGKLVFGPNLFDIVGKKSGVIDGYEYSEALKNANIIWDDKNLTEFVANPEQFIKGTKARFPGLKTSKQKADILAYLKSLK